MRWIVYSLILINLAVAGYFLLQPDTATETVVNSASNRSNVPALVLIEEFQRGQNAQKAAAPLVQRKSQAPNMVPINVPTEAKAIVNKASTEMCYAIGPYITSIDSGVMQEKITARRMTSIVKPIKTKRSDKVEYWVHIPPLDDRTNAQDILRQLQQAGMDSYVITQGELENGISLGWFRVKESADVVFDKARGLGLTPEVRAIEDSKTEYWVEVVETMRLDQSTRDALKAGNSSVSWQLIRCS
ncbi:MAG: hypothetical protein P1U57_14440 [Oleibacter sp.]|nr:hypothetical protein [Thalassolituus sp.]